MDIIPQDPILRFNPDTLVTLRRQYNYEKPGEMDAAVEVLENWIKKQEHFTKKDFSREYLERSIILVKGSVERAKSQIDKICTMRTLLPKFFEFNFQEFEEYKNKFSLALLPKLTKDNYRILTAKFLIPSSELNSTIFFVYMKFAVMLWEYLKIHDYCDGMTFIADYRGLNFVELVAAINLVEFHQFISICIHGFQMRIKGIHVVSESNTINVLVALFKQVLPKKIAERIYIHKTVDSLHKMFPKEILTSDLEGDQPFITKLHEDWHQLCKKETNLKEFKEICNAHTNEELRSSGKFNEEHLGTPGSFRTLNVD